VIPLAFTAQWNKSMNEDYFGAFAGSHRRDATHCPGDIGRVKFPA
jgi:hypothetical protein